MTRAIHHRGPDAGGVYDNGQVGLGHRRLSIIDLSGAGRQPMCKEDRSLVIVYNGEAFNHEYVASAIPGYLDLSQQAAELGFDQGFVFLYPLN